MMRIVATAVFVLAVSSTAQAQAPPPRVSDLKAPTSPAFVLLDVTPAAVERPQSPKAFAVNLLGNLSASGLPENYALEVAPYWMRSHSDLTFEQYQAAKGLQGLIQTFSISVATVPLKTSPSADSTGTRLGLGLRANFLNGKQNPRLAGILKKLEAVNMQILDLFEKGGSDADLAKLRAQAKTIALSIQDLDTQRVGFILSFAAGQTWSFAADDFELKERGKFGAWLTPTYRVLMCSETDDKSCSTTLDFIGVVRAMGEPDQDTKWDFGGRFVWQPNKEFDVSVEIVRRNHASDADRNSTNRTAGIISYRIREDLAIYGTFGKDFKTADDKRPLVSIVGMNIGFGKAPPQPVGK